MLNLVWFLCAKIQLLTNQTSNPCSSQYRKASETYQRRRSVWFDMFFCSLEKRQSIVEASRGWMDVSRPCLAVRPHIGQMTYTDQ